MVDAGALRTKALDAAFDLLPGKVTATVTPKGGEPIEDVEAIFMGPVTEEHPGGLQLRRAEQSYGIALRRADVSELPTGSLIVCPEIEGGTPRTWRVEGPSFQAADHRRFTIAPTD